jgi:hypothetical protein
MSEMRLFGGWLQELNVRYMKTCRVTQPSELR